MNIRAQYRRVSISCMMACMVELCRVSAFASVTINPDASATICLNAATTLTATANPTPPSYNCPCNSDGSSGTVEEDPDFPPDYEWSGSASGNGDNTAQLNTSTAGAQSVTVTVTYYWTCTSDPTADIPPTTDTATVAYTVNPALTFSTSSGVVCAGGTVALGPAAGGSGGGYTFTSSDTSVATVDGSGNVTGVRRGTATITLTDSANCTATASVTVNDVVIAGSNQIGIASVVGTALGTTQLSASGQAATWSSSNTSIATVNSSTGLVTGIAAGTATITATVNGCTGTYSVTVNSSPPSPVTITSTQTMVQVGASTSSGSFSVTGGTPPYTWQSSEPSTASVSGSSTSPIVNGLVVGTTSITAKDSNGTISNAIGVTVYDIATSTEDPAPDGSPSSRTDVGLGEIVDCSLVPSGITSGFATIWGANNLGGDNSSIDSTSGVLTIGDVAGQVAPTVSGSPSSGTGPTLTDHAPEGVSAVPVTTGQIKAPADVYTQFTLTYLPKSVDLSHNGIKEIKVPEATSGYFALPNFPAGTWNHNPNTAWSQIKPGNVLEYPDNVGCNATPGNESANGLVPPAAWSFGTIKIPIPLNYATDTDIGANGGMSNATYTGKNFTTIHQNITLINADGDINASKFSKTISYP